MKKLLSLALCLALVLGLLAVGAAAYVSPDGATVLLSPQNLMVNGEIYECEKYNIDDSNYFKLRDLAYLLMGTDAEFGVGYDSASKSVIIVPGMPYEPDGSELVLRGDLSGTAQVTSQSVWILDADASDLSIYNIGGNNFFKLRDLNTILGFLVDYDKASNTAIIETTDYAGAQGSADQAATFAAVWDWVQDNYTEDLGGEREYSERHVWDNGDIADYELVAAVLGGEERLIAISTYYYVDGMTDVTWIFLDAGSPSFYATYDYYDVGNEDLLGADFSGSWELVAADFVGGEPVVFDEVEGPLALDMDYDFEAAASASVTDTLMWLDSVIHGSEGLEGCCALDFGFDEAAFDV